MTASSQIIIERVFDAEHGRSVVVSVYAPEPDPPPEGTFRCGFKISGLGGHDGKVRYVCGVDSMQALTLALQLIAAFLYSSDEAKAGHLTWLGGGDLGLPLQESLRDLGPNTSA